MFEYASVFVNMLLTHVVAVCIKLYPQRKHIRMGMWQVVLVFLGIAALQLAGYLFIRSIVEYSYLLIQLYKLFAMIITMVVPFILVPRRFFQNLFLLGVTFNMYVMIFGMANYVEVMHGNAFARNYPYLISNGVTVLLQIVCLPILASYLKKMFAVWDGMERAAIWKIIWLLPTLFFAFAMAAQNIISGVTSSLSYVIIRFLVGCGVITVCYVLAKALREEAEKAGLAENARMTQNQLALQRERYSAMQDSVESARKSRHDLRHQLAVLSRYAESGDNAAIQNYIADLTGSLPDKPARTLCENHAVDAVVGHYISLAEKAGIEADVRIVLPEETGSISASDLCIVFGNLLENAVEACGRMTGGKRFIQVRAEVSHGFFILSVVNSFDGQWRSEGGVFYSRKREGDTEGVGFSSVRAIAEKYDGFCEFKAAGRQFESAVTLRIEARSE